MARFFRINSGSGLPVYRCQQCQGIYNLYSGTVFAGSQLAPVHVVLSLRGVLQGQRSAHLAREIGLLPIRITGILESMSESITTKRTRQRTPNNPTTTGFRVSDALWAVLEPLIPVRLNTHRFGGGRPRVPDRR